MSTASVPAPPAPANLAAIRTHANRCFGFALGYTGSGLVLLIASAVAESGGPGILFETALVFMVVSVAFTFLRGAVALVHTVLQSQEERLARLEALLAERGSL